MNRFKTFFHEVFDVIKISNIAIEILIRNYIVFTNLKDFLDLENEENMKETWWRRLQFF